MPKKEKDIIEFVNRCYTRGSSYKDTSGWKKQAIKSLNYYEHHQWPGDQWEDQQLRLTLNRVNPQIKNVIALLLQARPTPELQGFGPEDQDMAEVLRHVFDFSLAQSNFQYVWGQVVADFVKIGLGVIKERHDPDLEEGLGELVCERIDPVNEIIIDPNTRAFLPEYDGEWIIHVKRVRTDELKLIYPEHAEKIVPDDELQESKSFENEGYYTDYNETHSQPLSAAPVPTTEAQEEKYTTVKEMWYKELEVRKGVWKDGEFVEKADIPKEELANYDIITRVFTEIRVATVVGDTLLFDKESDYNHGKFPFIFLPDTELHGKAYPVGRIYYLFGRQDAYNKLNSLVIDNAIRTHNTGFIADEEALSEPMKRNLEKLGARPGVLIETRPGKRFEKMAPAPLPHGFLTLAETISVSFDEGSGVRDVQKGGMPYETSGKGILALQSAADILNVPDQLKLNTLLTQFAKLRLTNIQQFYNTERLIRINPETEKYLFIPINQEVPAQQIAGLAQQAGINPEAEFIKTPEGVLSRKEEEGEVKYMLNDLSIGKFDIKFVIGQSPERDRRVKAEIATALYDRMPGMAMFENLLEEMDVHNRKKLIERIQQENKALQMGQQVLNDPELTKLVERYQEYVSQLQAQAAQGGQAGQQPQGGGAPTEQPAPMPGEGEMPPQGV